MGYWPDVAVNGLEAIQTVASRLARQYPDLSPELSNVLSVRLREANGCIAELTPIRLRELHKLFVHLA